MLSVPADANHGLRIAVATVAALIAFGAIVMSRLRAARVDREQMEEGTRDGRPSGVGAHRG
jgi:K(+)-stimulated pyrophosphate-energized sodium pump